MRDQPLDLGSALDDTDISSNPKKSIHNGPDVRQLEVHHFSEKAHFPSVAGLRFVVLPLSAGRRNDLLEVTEEQWVALAEMTRKGKS